MQLTELEAMGITAGLGALGAIKRIRRINEDFMRVPKNAVDEAQEEQVSKVNQYFDKMKTETADEG